MFSVKTKQKNKDWSKDLLKHWSKLSDEQIAVGFPSGAKGIASPHYKNGASILEVAFINNFGTEGIPERPFFSDSKEPLEENYKDMVAEAMPEINAGKLNPQTINKAIAIESESIVRNQIDNGDYEPNAPSTIIRKGSSKPLIDSGDMRKYVTSVIRKK